MKSINKSVDYVGRTDLQLTYVIRHLDGEGLLVETAGPTEDRRIDGLTDDSRRVTPQSLFVAISGGKADGHLFIDKAVQDGAIVVLCEVMPESPEAFAGTTFLRVRSTRAALAEVGALYYGKPARALKLIGVTGTNGKTTVTFLVRYLLETLGVRTGLIGTVWLYLGGDPIESRLTTPAPLDVQRMLREMVDRGCRMCVMEVSSHALDQDRVRTLTFDVAAFTNLTQDHLDYHGTMERYLAAKKRLFDVLPASSTAVINTDDPAAEALVQSTDAHIIRYGTADGANAQFEIVENTIRGLRLRIDGKEREFRLVGRFNAYNLAAAYAIGCALGYESDRVLDVLADAPAVPGRFEQMHFPEDITAIVDYAHTPDALENVLSTALDTRTPGSKLWCVFGCGGDRDPTKRPLMGAVVERLSDAVVVTSDNPRTEDPNLILQDIRRGMRAPENHTWLVDRSDAIRYAVSNASPGDVIVVAGKGHENYQIVGTERRDYDDRTELKQAFLERQQR